jgi:hypothetical protein
MRLAYAFTPPEVASPQTKAAEQAAATPARFDKPARDTIRRDNSLDQNTPETGATW